MALFPRFGRENPDQVLIRRPQIQEQLTRDEDPRLVGFLMKELGSLKKGTLRQVPTSTFLQGAVFPNDPIPRDDVSVPFSSDPSRR